MASLGYRLSRFGTISLTSEQSNSVELSLRVISRVRRAVSYKNFNWIPPRELWLRVVGLDSQGSVCWEWEAHWPSQITSIQSNPNIQAGVNVCKSSQTLYSEIMGELAKKPNIPPLPPSLPPTGSFFSVPVGPPLDLRHLLFKSIDEGDFDVYLTWTARPSGSDCEPPPLPPEPLPPLENALPGPGSSGSPPPALGSYNVPSLAPGTPAIGGTSLIPPGYPPGYQSSPPTTSGRLRLAFAATQLVNGATCEANISFTEFKEIDWSGPTPAPGDFQMEQTDTGGRSCGYPYAPFTLRYKGAVYQPLVSTVFLGANNPIWPCTSIQQL